MVKPHPHPREEGGRHSHTTPVSLRVTQDPRERDCGSAARVTALKTGTHLCPKHACNFPNQTLRFSVAYSVRLSALICSRVLLSHRYRRRDAHKPAARSSAHARSQWPCVHSGVGRVTCASGRRSMIDTFYINGSVFSLIIGFEIIFFWWISYLTRMASKESKYNIPITPKEWAFWCNI